MNSKKKSRKVKQKPRMPYSEGELNRLIDSIFHPLYHKSEVFRLLDGLAHGVVEQDSVISLKKFLKYNIPDLVKKVSKQKR